MPDIRQAMRGQVIDANGPKVVRLTLVFRTAVRENWREMVEPPKKPTKWGDEAWERHVEEEWAKKEADAANDVIAGRISKVLAREDDGTDHSLNNATELLALLDGKGLGYACVGMLYGINLTACLRQCAWDIIRSDSTTPVPPYLWGVFPPGLAMSAPVLVVDPYSSSGAKAAGISVERWAAAWRLPLDGSMEVEAGTVILASKRLALM